MITGRIIRIFDDLTVAINVGSTHGVQPGMRFGIYTPYEDVVDPETSVTLGQTRRRKAIIRVTAIHPLFTVASVPSYRVQSKSSQSLLGGLTTTEYEERQDPLPVAQSDVQPFETGTIVRLGDHVEQLSERSTSSSPQAAAAGS